MNLETHKENNLLTGAVLGQLDLLSAWIESQMAYAGQPGLSIGIVHDQQLVWAKDFGCADLENQIPTSPSTFYRIASNTKLFTAIALMQLRDAAQLSLDDPVEKYLDWFRIQPFAPDSAPITIRQLITHTSGLPREAAFPYFADHDFPTAEQIRETLPSQQALLVPGTKVKYSNLALGIAGELVAAVSGQDCADYIQSHILEPLEMSQTRVTAPEKDDPALAKGYGRRLPSGERKANYFTDLKGLGPAGNMTSTVEDFARFIMLQFRDDEAGGAQILKGRTLREMRQVQWLHPDWKNAWGLGFRISRVRDTTFFGHGGWVSGYRTAFQFDPVQKVGVIVFTNADDGNPDMYVDSAFRWVIPQLHEAATSSQNGSGIATGAAATKPDYSPYIGRYRDLWGDLQVLPVNGQLVAINPSLPDPLSVRLTLIPQGEHLFYVESEDMLGAHGEPVTFEIGADGTAACISFVARRVLRIIQW